MNNNNDINILMALGYKYNFDKSYLFKTIRIDYLEATSFYQNGKFEVVGADILVKILENEIKELKRNGK